MKQRLIVFGLVAVIAVLVATRLHYLLDDRPPPTVTALAERARMLKLPVPDVQKQYQSVMLEVGDRYVTVRTYCYKGTLIFTSVKGEPFGVAGGACAWKSH